MQCKELCVTYILRLKNFHILFKLAITKPFSVVHDVARSVTAPTSVGLAVSAKRRETFHRKPQHTNGRYLCCRRNLLPDGLLEDDLLDGIGFGSRKGITATSQKPELMKIKVSKFNVSKLQSFKAARFQNFDSEFPTCVGRTFPTISKCPTLAFPKILFLKMIWDFLGLFGVSWCLQR